MTDSKPVRRTSKRWCVPSAIVRDPHETLEALPLLDEIGGAIGIYLWQRVRDVVLWAEAAAADRAWIFGEEAAERADQVLRAATPHDLPRAAVASFRRLLTQPELIEAERIAHAAEAVASWAQGQGADATALAYSQASALTIPESAGRALAVGRLAARVGQEARAATWLWRAIGLARRSGEWSAYAHAHVELGILRERRVDDEGARNRFRKAIRAGRRYQLRDAAGAAAHGLMRVALRRDELEEAERWGRHARRMLRQMPSDLEHDLAELMVRRGEGATAITILERLLAGRSDAGRRGHTLGLLCRASAQAGDRATLERLWPQVEELARAPDAGEEARRALLELARAAAALGVTQRAEVVARRALADARTPEEVAAASTLLQSLGS